MSSGDRRALTWALALAAALLVGLLGLWWWLPEPHKQPPQPTPVVIPGLDSGFHEAQDGGGTIFRIDKRYDAMNDDERDAANRFARLYPSGK